MKIFPRSATIPQACTLLPVCFLLFCAPSVGHASETHDADPHGIDAKELHDLIVAGGTPLLFVDVRDPVEIQFTGFTDMVDVHIPFVLADPGRLNAGRSGLLMDRNPDFALEVAAALQAKGLERDALIVTICRSGSARGLPSAAYLRDQGFSNARYVVHGFQGDPLREGPQAGLRLKNGWQNSGLPWSPEINPGKIALRPVRDGSQPLLVVLNSGSLETQAMALILARASLQRGRDVRVLLCDDAGLLAVKESDAGSGIVRPLETSPREMLGLLISEGVPVEVCGIFIPTRDLGGDALVPGVGVASPPAVSVLLTDPLVRVVVF